MTRRLVLVTALLSVGGVERHHLRMIDSLVSRGWEITVVVTVPGEHGCYVRMSVEHATDIDLTVAVGGAFLDRWMRERGRTGDNIEVCYDGIDVAHWRPDADLRARVRSDLGITDDQPLIVFIGRMSQE